MNEEPKEKKVILLSGGIDSTTLLYDAINQGYEVFPIAFDYGQSHRKELEYAITICAKLYLSLEIFQVPVLGQIAVSVLTGGKAKDLANAKLTVVPNRNMVLIALATSYAISKKIWFVLYGAQSGDHVIYADCRPEFVLAMRSAVGACDFNNITLEAPFVNKTKVEVIELGLSLNIDYANTWTCYDSLEKPCMKCASCKGRIEAMEQLGRKYDGTKK